jgi:L-asparaginase
LVTEPRVCILYTGGTIGMRRTAQGFAPAPGYLGQQMAALVEFKNPALPGYDILEFDPLLDSANMTPADWLKIARRIEAVYTSYAGFVVIHGTDTMAYTASALAFLLEGLDKPVVLTGSQIPLCEVRSDAVENLITALLIAGSYPVPEVCLYFGGRLLRGCRATKVSASGLSAFDSPNYPLLGTAGIDLQMNWGAILPPPPGPSSLMIENTSAPLVGVLKLFPGIQPWMVASFLRPPLQGAVLEAYGVGSVPDHAAELIAAFAQADAHGIVIVDVTQCRQGVVNLGSYSTGAPLVDAGVLGGLDLTTEAALTKLFYLFGCGCTSEQVKTQVPINLRGELTPARPAWQRYPGA